MPDARTNALPVPSSAELQARDAAKHAGMTAAMVAALGERGVPHLVAALAAELGGLAFREAYATWVADEEAPELAVLVGEALERSYEASSRLDVSQKRAEHLRQDRVALPAERHGETPGGLAPSFRRTRAPPWARAAPPSARGGAPPSPR